MSSTLSEDWNPTVDQKRMALAAICIEDVIAHTELEGWRLENLEAAVKELWTMSGVPERKESPT